MSFHFANLFGCCLPKKNGEEYEKQVDVCVEDDNDNDMTLIKHIAPAVKESDCKGIGRKNREENGQSSTIIKTKESILSTSTPKIKHRQMKPFAPIGTAIIGFDKLLMNEIMEEQKDYIPTNLNIHPTDIQSAPKGQIDNDISDLLSTSLSFNALGLIYNGRQVKDGVIIFGKVNQNDDKKMIDCYLNFIEESYIQSHLFIIYYNKEQENYIIKFNVDEHSELAKNIYIKLAYNPIAGFAIKNKEIVIACNLVFHLLPCCNGILHLIDTQKKNKKYMFKPNKNGESTSIVTIGRDEACTLSYPEEKGLSKIHLQLCYISEEQHWVLKDGSNKPTTNSNWLVGLNHYPLYEGFELEIYKKKLRFTFN